MDVEASEEWHGQLYNRLPIKSDQLKIRLLRLKAGEGTTPLQGRMFRTTLANSPSYEALSYTWGTSKQRKPMPVNGIQVSITENLDYALRNLRMATQSRTIWIDALCVNQTDVEERNAQVREMGEIYSSALQVVIWPREPPTNTWYVEDAQAIDRLAVKHIQHVLDSIDSLHLQLWWSADTCAARAAVLTLLSHRWWTRVWVVQETARARSDPLFQLVGASIYWSKVIAFVSLCASRRYPEGPLTKKIDSASPVMIMDKIRRSIRTPPRLRHLEMGTIAQTTSEQTLSDLAFLLSQTQAFDASDPRDKVFGLWTLVRSPDTHHLRPDYGKSIPEVFMMSARAILMSSTGIALLARSCQIGGNTKSTGSWEGLSTHVRPPSWVPDFSAVSRPYLPIDHRLGRMLQEPQHHFDGDQLMIYGYNLGVVAEIVQSKARDVMPWLNMLPPNFAAYGIETPLIEWTDEDKRRERLSNFWEEYFSREVGNSQYSFFVTSRGLRGRGDLSVVKVGQEIVILDGVPTVVVLEQRSGGSEQRRICGNVEIFAPRIVDDLRSEFKLERTTFALD